MMERLTTGSSEIDAILGGGFPKDTICLISGSPGTGKTVLALQTLFANVGPECKGLYLTTLSEPFYKLTRFMQTLSFYDEAKMLGGIVFHDLGGEIGEKGIAALPSVLAALIKQVAPRLVVIDSFKALHDLAPSEDIFRSILYQSAALLTGYACTTLWLGEYPPDAPEREPEFAVADGILEMVNKKLGVSDERYLRVIKQRGSAYASGEHALKITGDGIKAFPRLITSGTLPSYSIDEKCFSTGLPVLDRMLAGGIMWGSSTLVAGKSGTGKTLLSLSILNAGGKAGEDCLYVSFQESPQMLRYAASGIGLGLEGVELLYNSPVEVNIDEVIWQVRAQLDEKPIRRIVVDSLGDLEAACWDKVRFRHYLYSLGQLTHSRQIGLIMVCELPGLNSRDVLGLHDISYLSDNMILLDSGGRNVRRRHIQVLKQRGSQHDMAGHAFAITPGRGLVIEES